MSETNTSVAMLEPIEDLGGVAQPLLQVHGLTKHFPVRERFDLKFQGDFFNAFNVTNFQNFSNSNLTSGNSNFGTILSAQDPRILQFALKYMF